MNRNDIVEYWHDRYGFDKDIVSVAMAIVESGDRLIEGPYVWRLEGAEQEMIQSYCRILQKMGPSDQKEICDFRRLWEAAQ